MILALVPSVQAMVALRIKIAKNEWPSLTRQGELFVDAVRPSAPLEALNTYMHIAVLYGKSPVGLPMPGAAVGIGIKIAEKCRWRFRQTGQIKNSLLSAHSEFNGPSYNPDIVRPSDLAEWQVA